MIVVDASAILEVLLRTPVAPRVEAHLFEQPRRSMHAPHLLDLEVAQVMRRYAAAGELSAERGRVALEDLAAFPIRRYPHDLFLARIWDLRDNFSAYDAAYVAVGEALDAPLLTRDQRLAAAARRHVQVELVQVVGEEF